LQKSTSLKIEGKKSNSRKPPQNRLTPKTCKPQIAGRKNWMGIQKEKGNGRQRKPTTATNPFKTLPASKNKTHQKFFKKPPITA